jgi:hypothetical protein
MAHKTAQAWYQTGPVVEYLRGNAGLSGLPSSRQPLLNLGDLCHDRGQTPKECATLLENQQ